MTDPLSAWGPPRSRLLAISLLREHPHRLAHSLRAGWQAQRLSRAVPPADRGLLVSAAFLHDIGYAPALRETGFHPVDGARHLIGLGAPRRLAALVAHHSEAWLLAEAAGLLSALSAFARERGPVPDALTCADMTSGPSGAAISVGDRIADIAERHSHDGDAAVAARAARVPYILAAAERTRARMPGAAAAAATHRLPPFGARAPRSRMT